MPKKIKNKYKKIRKNNKKEINYAKIIWGVVVGFIMIFSVIGYVNVFNTEKVVKYKDYKFEFSQKTRKFITRIKGNIIQMTFLPQDVENISFHFVRTPQILIYYNVSEEYIQDLAFGLIDLYNLYYKNIMIQKLNESQKELLQDCSTLTLIFTNVQNISTKKNCIYLPINNYITIKAIDYIVYRYLNILE